MYHASNRRRNCAVDTDLHEAARRLGGEIRDNQILAPGPGHTEKDRSLSVKFDPSAPGGMLIYSFAGDSYPACRDYVASKLGLSLQDQSKYGRHATRKRESVRVRRTVLVSSDQSCEDKRSVRPLAHWNAAASPEDTPVQTYAASRQLQLPPHALRHAVLKHPTGGVWPTMVALVSRVDGTPIAIHRTFLARDGRGKAPVEPKKMMLGPCRGGAVRLALPGDVLMIGEGIETCLAAMQATGYPAWAALSTSGLRSLELPADIRNLIILADGDEAGEAAAMHAGLRWKREGRRVRIARPPSGLDFNDVVMGRRASDVGRAS
jgi:putative DNA primase/helicase